MFSGSVPFSFCVPNIPPIRHPMTDIHRSSYPIFRPHSSLGPPGQKIVYLLWPPPPVLHSLSFCPRTAPQVSVSLCIPALWACFFWLVSHTVSPLYLPLMLLETLSTPVGSLFWITSFFRNLSKQPLPFRLWLASLVPSSTEEGRVSGPGIVPFSIVLSLHLILCQPVSWCLPGVIIIVWAPFCAFLRGLGVSTPC